MSPFDVILLELLVPAAAMVLIVGGLVGCVIYAVVQRIIEAIES